MPATSNANATIRVIIGTLARKPRARAPRFLVTSCIFCRGGPPWPPQVTLFRWLGWPPRATPTINYIQLHLIIAIPSARFQRVGEFDAAVQLGSLPRRLDAIPPNCFEWTVLRPSKPQFQMAVLQHNRRGQTAQVLRHKHWTRIACAKRFQSFQLSCQSKRNALRR